jgi:hypothetical protein
MGAIAGWYKRKLGIGGGTGEVLKSLILWIVAIKKHKNGEGLM